MYIFNADGFVNQAAPERESLKPQLQALGVSSLRRAGRFNQLAVLGAVRCASSMTLPQTSDVMVAAVANNVSDTAAILSDVTVNHQSPKPFDFMNTQGNSACYNVASTLELEGASLFVAHPDAPLESALMLAKVRGYFSSAELLMLGVVGEWSLPYYQPPTGYLSQEEQASYEGSCWFAIGASSENFRPVAEILGAKQTLNNEEVLKALMHIDVAKKIDWDVCPKAQSIIGLAAHAAMTDSMQVRTSLHESVAVVSWLQQKESGYYCKVRANRTGGFRWLLIKRYV